MFKNAIRREVRNLGKEIKEKMREDLKEITDKTCRELVCEMFNNPQDSELVSSMYSCYPIPTIGKKFKDRAIAAVQAEVDETCKVKAKSVVMGEEFIDAIIKRIRDKQLLISAK